MIYRGWFSDYVGEKGMGDGSTEDEVIKVVGGVLKKVGLALAKKCKSSL